MMANRKPLTLSTGGAIEELPASDGLSVGNAAISAANVSTAQTYSLPATGGTLALSTEVGGTRFIDGGNASSVYTAEQILDGGGA